MTTICLLNYRSSYFASLTVRITVTCQDYKCSNLFHRYEHELKTPTGGKIYLYEGKSYAVSYLYNYATLKPENGYESSKLHKVYAYANRFDSTNRFLILVFCFTNGSPSVNNKYYSYSELNPPGHTSMNIKSLIDYTNDESILCPLLEENDKLDKLLTYDILKRPGESNGPCTYNCGKIKVTDDTNSNVPKLTGTGFKRYKHAPTSGNNGNNNTGKPACVIYDCQTLKGSNGAGKSDEFAGIQGVNYKHVCVYFGTKAKRKGPGKVQGDCKPGTSSGSTCTPGKDKCPATTTCTAPDSPDTTSPCSHHVPLLLELNKQGNGDIPQYYVHRRTTNGGDKYYWVHLSCGNGVTGRRNGECVLKDLLDDIGLHTKKNGTGDNGYQVLQKLLSSAGINGMKAPPNGDLSTQLQQATGQNLTNLLKANINGTSSPQNGQTAVVTLLLKRIEFNITDSVVILLDKKNGLQNGGYGDQEIQSAIKALKSNGNKAGVNPLKLNGNGGTKTIQVTQVTDTPTKNGDICQCLKQYGYRVVAHDFTSAVSGLGIGCHVGLRFLIPTQDNGLASGGGRDTKYAELKLYPSDTETGPEHLQYLYYQNGGQGTCNSECSISTKAQTCSKVYVVFYQGTATNSGGSTNADPRPLLMCYAGCWYRPKDKDHYFEQWVTVDGLDKSAGTCACADGGSKGPGTTDCQTHQALLKAVTQVIGFLNQVQLQVHPKGTGEGGHQAQCENGGQTCQPARTSGSSNGKCTYTVHTNMGKPISVQVNCEDVQSTGTPTTARMCGQPTGSTCYRKLTHLPIGTNGVSPNNGFRLGDIVYFGKGSSVQGRIEYYPNGSPGPHNGNLASNHKYNPLLSVTTYFYNEDKTYCDPLLVELVFAKVTSNGVQGQNGLKEYYYLKERNGDNGNRLVWEKDNKAGTAMSTNASGHLDAIRFCLKKVVRIRLECNGTSGKASYELKGRTTKGGITGQFSEPINGPHPGSGTVQVEVCECPGCKTLTDRHYKCLRHKLNEALNGHHHQVAGLAFTLPAENGAPGNGKAIEVPLYAADGQGGAQQGQCPAVQPGPSTSDAPCPPGAKQGEKISPLTYNSCIGDICVYFYCHANGAPKPSGSPNGDQTDTVPLILRYNNQFYAPCDRETYFTRWVCVSTLAGKGGCCCPGQDASHGNDCSDCQKLVSELDRVNAALNRIDLDHKKAKQTSSGTWYGFPESVNGGATKVDTGKFPTERVKVVKQDGPSSNGTHVYTRVIHRTKNGFNIGDITYCCKDITKEGVNLSLLKNGSCQNGAITGDGSNCKIPVSSKNHKSQANGNGWNTVAAYYSCTDKSKQLPQLIVILKTDKPVDNGGTVTGDKNTAYGYYLLSNGGRGIDGHRFEYKWVDVNGSTKPPETPVTLDEKTDFRLLNSAVILTEWRSNMSSVQNGKYCDDQIKKVVDTAFKEKPELKSPGNQEGVNRLTGKTITVTDETGGNGDASTHQCIKKYGFKAMIHDITTLVELRSAFKGALAEVKLITGLRFVIPTKDNGNKYNQVKLCSDCDGDRCSNEDRHYHKSGAKIRVFFYDKDPRPLLLCYGSNAYTPKDKNGYDQQQWCKNSTVEQCVCNGQDTGSCVNCDKLLGVLTKVVGFLNTVQLQLHPGMGAGAQCQPAGGGQGASVSTQCKNGLPNTCKYEVHKFDGKPINIQVECCPVTNTQGSQTGPTCGQPAGSTCYKKLTHTPIGTNGTTSSASNGFRLGNVVYCPNSGGQPQGTIQYYPNGSDHNGNGNVSVHKWKPLLQVAVYYYNEDKEYCDPLLVGLTFKNGVGNGQKANEYYYLKEQNGTSMTWTKDQEAKCVVDRPDELVKHLDAIRLCLKFVVRIELQHNKANQKYELKGRAGKTNSGDFDQQIKGPPGNGKTQVTVCEVIPCPPLSGRHYKCLKHNLTSALSGKQHRVAGLVFTLPGTNGPGTGDKSIEIPLFGAKGQKNAQPGCPAGPASASPPGGATCSPVDELEPGKSTTLLYNQCMGDVCVYFYRPASGMPKPSEDTNGDWTDTVPLMLRFNGQFYKPENRDQYFTKWVCVKELCTVDKECGCPDQDYSHGAYCTSECKELADQLDEVNSALNRIDLDKSKQANGSGGSSGTGYGLPDTGGSTKVDKKKFDTVRVTLKEQNGPKQTGDGTSNGTHVYTRVIHRTKNGFWIGQLMYCAQEFTKGVTPTPENGKPCTNNGDSGAAQTCTANTVDGASCSTACPAAGSPSNGTKITVANGIKPNGHTDLLKKSNWNTVVVYYSCSDKCMWLPQLIVLLKTDSPVKNGQAVTAGNGNKKYGYYILATKNGSVGGGGSGSVGTSYEYQYRWVYVNGKEPQSEVKLDEATDFTLLNSAVILMERRVYNCGSCTYGENQICRAIKSAIGSGSLKESPGNSGQVNRLQYRDITVTDETQAAGTCCVTADSTSECKCLADTGFKVMTHDLCPLVKLTGFNGDICKINLIAGLKLLTPTSESGQYRQLTLNGSSTDANGSNNVKYHKPENNKVCVYFYGSDPRPLLLCYDGWAYKPKDKDQYDGQKWQKLDGVKCDCTQGKCENCKLLAELIRVSDFLNPVYLNMVSTFSKPCKYYFVDEFDGQRVWIRVSAQFACGPFCYNRFTHTHAGIRGNGKGFRLGTLHYGNGTGKNGVANGSSTCIKENGGTNNGGNGKCISASDVDDKNKHKASPEVVVFYYKGDTKHEHPLLVALKNPDGSNGKHKPYYELKQKFETGKQKEYKKGNKDTANGEIDLCDTSAGGQLAKKLDTILFTISKKLQIVLSKRPVEIDYKAEEDQACTKEKAEAVKSEGAEKEDLQKVKYLVTCKYKVLDHIAKTAKNDATRKPADPKILRDALMHHVQGSTEYKAHLCDKNGASESSSSSQSTNHIDVKVQEVTCDKSYSDGGYRCFKHVLTTAKDIAQVGGLKLCLWVTDGVAVTAGKAGGGECKPCTEQSGGTGNEGLTLCNGSGGTTGSGSQPVQLSYTTCKGDLYVFFYDEDPRPLMVCYDGEAYRPEKMDEYCSKWVKVKENGGGETCRVDIPFRRVEQVLKALFEVSMFLNPVKLRLTEQAIAKLRHKRDGEQSDGQPGASGSPRTQGLNGSPGHSDPSSAASDYTYCIDKNPPEPVQVRVVPQDLNCYRRYTHKTAKEGFRLGRVTYAEAKDGGAAKPGPPGPQGQTCPANPPATTSSAPANNNAFCFPYDSAKQLQSVCAYYYMYDWCHNWPLVIELGFKGRESEFFRLCSGPDKGGLANGGSSASGGSLNGGGAPGGGNGGDTQNGKGPSKPPKTGLKWVLMAGKGEKSQKADSCPNGSKPAASAAGGNGQCAECPPGSQGTTDTDSTGANGLSPEEKAEICRLDEEFVEQTRQLYKMAHGKDRPAVSPDFISNDRDLEDLIEGRAYEIRQSLHIDYGEKTQQRLILYTSAHCWEGWPLGYLVSGGALSVAAGGSWKFIVMAVGLFVKL